MQREIVVFERDERYTDNGGPELDWRLVRAILPAGSSPLAIANHDSFTVECGQWFSEDEVQQLAEVQSGYKAI